MELQNNMEKSKYNKELVRKVIIDSPSATRRLEIIQAENKSKTTTREVNSFPVGILEKILLKNTLKSNRV